LYYLKNYGLFLDFLIVIKTIQKLLTFWKFWGKIKKPKRSLFIFGLIF
jgi:lipopolysaccharide/colanic/teichoic acid biosynthesis glycosyltransferase